MNAAKEVRSVCELNMALRRRFFEKYNVYPVLYTPDMNYLTIHDITLLNEQNQMLSRQLQGM